MKWCNVTGFTAYHILSRGQKYTQKVQLMSKELLEKLKNAKTDEERKQIIETNKIELTDEDLEQVSGGKHPSLGCPKR